MSDSHEPISHGPVSYGLVSHGPVSHGSLFIWFAYICGLCGQNDRPSDQHTKVHTDQSID